MGRDAGAFGARLKALRETAGYTQEELATIAGLSVHAVSALERGERRRPHVDTVRALVSALDLTGPTRDALVLSARSSAADSAANELTTSSLPIERVRRSIARGGPSSPPSRSSRWCCWRSCRWSA